jgi:hypothetical protein
VVGNVREQSVEQVFGDRLPRLLSEFSPPRPETCAGCVMELYCRYCGLRGMMGSDAVEHCRWAEDATVQAIMSRRGVSDEARADGAACAASSCEGAAGGIATAVAESDVS